MKNIENKEELRQAATLALGATPEESAFWDEVASCLDNGASEPRKSLDVQPRLTRGSEKGTV